MRAGVIHDLQLQMRAVSAAHRERAPFAVCAFAAWRDDPLPGLMETIRSAADEALGDGGLEAWSPGASVEDTLRSWTERVRTLLVVVDQFEDYFLYHPDEGGEGSFAEAFPAIVNEPNLRVHFLLSIREDALAKLDRFKGQIPSLFANYVRVEHLSRAAARQAIEEPVREWNRRHADEEPYTLEPALVQAVVDAAATGELALVPAGAEPTLSADRKRVEAPFLQLVLDRLWRATVAAGSRALTLAGLETLGGPQRIVENHLLDALAALGTREQGVAADLFRFLVTRSKTKIAHPASDLAEWSGRPEAEVTVVLDKLCTGEGGRILRRVPPPPTGGATRYELFHDVLAEPILDWRREFEADRRRKRAVRRFVLVGGSLVALVALFGTLGIWALVQRNEAQSATRDATSLALASAAKAEVGEHVEKSLLLGLEALRSNPGAEASSAMIEALQSARRSSAEAILRGGADGVRTIAYSPDGRTLASVDFDGTVRLWDTEARETLGDPFRAHEEEVWGLAFSPDGETLASSSFDGTVRLWNVEDQRPLGEPIDPGASALRSIAFSPDGRLVAVGGADDTVRLLVVNDGRMLQPLRGHRSSVMAVAWSPDGRTLASGGADNSVRLWDVEGNAGRGRTLEGHEGKVVSVAFSPDGRTLASSDLAGEVRLWNVRTGEPLGEPLRSGTDEIWSVSFSPDGRTLASSGFGNPGTVHLWDVGTGRAIGQPLRGHSESVIALAHAPDGTLASSSYDGTVRLWGAERTSLGEPIGEHEDRVTTVSASPDGRTVASGGFDQLVRLWNLDAGRAAGELGEGRVDSLESVRYDPDGSTLASADVDGSIWLWEPPAATPVGQLQGHEGAVQSVAFDGDGATLASAGFDGTVMLWDVPGRKRIGGPLTGHEGPVWSVALSPDGNTLVSAGSDSTLRVWDVGERRVVDQLPLREGEVVQAVEFASDGRTLATGSVDGAVRLWDAQARVPLGEPLTGHTAEVEDVAFSPDGRIVASAGADESVRLWDVRGRRALGAPLLGHEGEVFGVAFASDGRTVVSGGDDKTVRLWEGILWRDLADLETQVCDLVVRDFTEAEWQELVPGLTYRRTCET